jgi:hypothetical protein
MENNENLVTEQVTENVEQTTEETPKYTEAQFNAKLDEVLGKKIARKEAKIRKEYERKYGDLENVLKAGTGKESVEEVTDSFRQFYEQKGVRIAPRSDYSDRDIELLAERDAKDIIDSGYDEVVEEVDRLAEKGVANMSAREKVLFKALAEHRNNTERGKELTKLGVTENVYNSQEFKDFSAKFSATTPIREIYDIYQKTQPKKEIKTMGSMKNATSEDGTVKDFYSYEEATKFTKKDFDKNPALYEAVRKSMTKW